MKRRQGVHLPILLIPLVLLGFLVSGCGDRAAAPAGEPAAEIDPGEQRRLQIYTEVIQAEDLADREAERRVPVTCTDEPVSREALQQWTALNAELMHQYRSEVLARYGLTDEEWDAIEVEAYEKDWPMPRPIDPCAPSEAPASGQP